MPYTTVVSGTPSLSGSTQGVVFSPNDAWLVVASGSSPYINVIDTSDWSLVSGTPVPAGFGRGVDFSPDTGYLAIALSVSPYLKVYDTSDWSEVPGTPTLPDQGWDVKFSPDGTKLAVGNQSTFPDPRLWVLDTSDWSIIPGIPSMPGTVEGVDWSPDGAYLAAAHSGVGNDLTIIDTSDWSVVPDTPAMPDNSRSVAWSADGAYVAVGHFDDVTVVDTSDWSIVPGTPSSGGARYDVEFSPDSKYLAAAGPFGDDVDVINIDTWSHEPGIPSVAGQGNAVAFSHSGTYLAVGHSSLPRITVLEAEFPSDLIATLDDTAASFQGEVDIIGDISVTLDDASLAITGQFGTGDMVVTLDDTTADFQATFIPYTGDIVVTLGDTGALFVTSHEPNSRVVSLEVGAQSALEIPMSSFSTLEAGTLLASETFYNPQAEATLAGAAEAIFIALRHYLRDELLEADAELTVQATALASLWLRVSAEGVTQTFTQRTEEALLEAIADLIGQAAFAESMQLVAEADDVTQQELITQILDQVSAELVPEATLTVVVEDTLVAEASDSVEVLALLMQNVTEHAGVWATFKLSDEVVAGWVMNVEGAQPFSEYDNFEFNSFAKVGDTYFAASDEGIYRLGADTDEGEQIDAHVTSMMLDFGTPRQKRVVSAYLGYTSTGVVVLKVRSVEDGKLVEHWYEANEEVADAPRDGYAPLGRGMKSRYWQFTLANKDGADFEISSLELLPIILQRRV